jgi:hypothetical protein
MPIQLPLKILHLARLTLSQMLYMLAYLNLTILNFLLENITIEAEVEVTIEAEAEAGSIAMLLTNHNTRFASNEVTQQPSVITALNWHLLVQNLLILSRIRLFWQNRLPLLLLPDFLIQEQQLMSPLI